MEFQPTLLVNCMFAVRSVVLAAEARKAESASVEAQRTSRLLSLTGKDAWSQRSSSKSTVRMVDKPSVSKSSNRAKLGQSAQTAVRILYISVGTLKLFLSRTRASCVWSMDSRLIARSMSFALDCKTISAAGPGTRGAPNRVVFRSEEHTSELQSPDHLLYPL